MELDLGEMWVVAYAAYNVHDNIIYRVLTCER